MAITSLDTLIAGLLPPVEFMKLATQTHKAAGQPHSSFYAAGFPGAGVASSAGLAGEALTGPVAGQIPFPAAVGGTKVYLARMTFGLNSPSVAGVNLVDRLWQNSGFVVTSTSAQTINSVTFPARDRNGATAGDGVNLAMEVTALMGAGTPTLTVTYTNQAGTTGRTGTITVLTTSGVGTFFPMSLESGDTGVRSVQTIQSSATMTSGSVSFVAYRHLAGMPTVGTGALTFDRDAVALGLPAVHDSSVPFWVYMPATTTGLLSSGAVVWAQG